MTDFAIYFAGLSVIASLGWVVARPLFAGADEARLLGPDDEPSPAEHVRAEALQALRDAEFDRQVGKISDEDYALLRRNLERKALEAMAATETDPKP